MATATDKLLDQVSGAADSFGDLKPAILGVELENFLLDVIKHRGLNINIAGSITDGTIERAIDTASTVSVTFHDPRRILLNSDIWDYIIDISVNGFDFRLAQVGKDGDDLNLVFEDKMVALLRQHRKPLAISRNKMTRAEFIRHMVMELKRGHPSVDVDFFSPELHKKQPIKKAKKPKERRKHKAPGLHKDIKVVDPSKSQGTDQGAEVQYRARPRCRRSQARSSSRSDRRDDVYLPGVALFDLRDERRPRRVVSTRSSVLACDSQP
jgi:hypothetical protein